MSATKVTCTDVETGESNDVEIENNYVLVTNGTCFLASQTNYHTGTVILVVKRPGHRQ